MKCFKCTDAELVTQNHYWPDKEHIHGINQDGLPEDWYSYSDKKPQDGGKCPSCGERYMKIKNGDIYTWERGWKLFKKRKEFRKNVTPIGGRWVQ